MTKRIVSTGADYRANEFIKARMLERPTFPRGTEIEIEFEGRGRFEGYGMARQAAKVYSGLLLLDGSSKAGSTVGISTIDHVATIGPFDGHVTGFQTGDGKQGWRIDWDAKKRFHINWWDRRGDTSPRGNKDKTQHFKGANIVVGGDLQLLWELLSHFPGRVRD